ncbi:MAG: ssuC [Gammaproteobacteria bacterium]|nr:ssuC [Gammaproteobacteria bacterium]
MLKRSLISVVSLIVLWQGLIWLYHFPPYILPSPWQVGLVWRHGWPILLQQSIPTLWETMASFILAAVVGSVTALILAYFTWARSWLFPWVLVSQALPTFALAPLLVVWLGYGMSSKIVTALIMMFFPITSAFYDGLRRTKPEWLDLAKTMNAKKTAVLWFICFPAALPNLASGLRVAAVLAPMGAVVGEWVGSSHGLGYLMLNANARMQIDWMFAAVMAITVWTLLLYALVDRILKKLVTWH